MFALAAVFVFAGCGEKRHSGGGASSTTISESEFNLSPSSSSVSAGSAITVKNDGQVTHALDIKLPNGDVRTKSLAPGSSVQVTAPSKAGTYTMYCPIDGHRQNGMFGKLTVSGSSSKGPSPSSSPGGY